MTGWRALDPELVERALRVMAAASIVAEGPAANINPAPAHTAPGSSPPHDQGRALFDVIVEQIAKARTDESLRDAVHRSEVSLDRYRRRQLSPSERPVESPQRRDQRILRDYEGLLPIEAARWENVTVENIIRVRRDHDRDPASGKEREHTWRTPNERVVLVKQMARIGKSTREIARDLMVSQTTVIRDLNP